MGSCCSHNWQIVAVDGCAMHRLIVSVCKEGGLQAGPLGEHAGSQLLLLLRVSLPVSCRLIRQGMAKKVERSRKQLKEKKNRLRKVRGIKKAKN